MNLHHTASRIRNPSRHLDWRWQQANALGVTPGRRSDDPWLNAACDHLEGVKNGPRQVAVQATIELLEPQHLGRRSAIEAWLLNGRSLAEVAQRCELPTEIAEAYAHLRFDVQDRLTAKKWIEENVLSLAPDVKNIAERLRFFCRNVGYFCGPILLESVLAIGQGRPFPDSLLKSSGAAREEERERLTLRTELFIRMELAETQEDRVHVMELQRELRRRFPAYVSEIPELACALYVGPIKKVSKKAKGLVQKASPPAAIKFPESPSLAALATTLQ